MKDFETQLATEKHKVLLLVFPHPDDETVMAGGLIQRAKKLGWRVVVACLTQGERGQIHIHGKGRSVGEMRREELRKALGHLGNIEIRQFDFPDGHLNHCDWWQRTIGNLIKEIKPSYVLTYDFSGATGHPDHISLSLEIFRQLKKQKTIRLFWVGFTKELRNILVPPKLHRYSPLADYELQLTLFETIQKSLGLLAYMSQGLWKNRKLWRWFWRYRAEYFSEAQLTQAYPYQYIEFKI